MAFYFIVLPPSFAVNLATVYFCGYSVFVATYVRSSKNMRNFFIISLLIMGLINSAPSVIAQEAVDYPLLSQGSIEPPPPPPGYAVTLPPLEPVAKTSEFVPPSPPVQPDSGDASEVPESGRFSQSFQPASLPDSAVSVQIISSELAEQVMRLVRSLKTMRTLLDKPESAVEIRRIQLTSSICARLLDLKGFPEPTIFMAGAGDKVLRDRSFGAVEYRYYGDFDNRVNGWVKPVETAVYIDLVFDGRSRRRTHVRAHITRSGSLTGAFYAYSWDARGNPWKMQGSMEGIFVHDDGLPAGGVLKVYGSDPSGKSMGLILNFPVKIHAQVEPHKKDTRHREGQRVSIENR